MVFLSTNSVYDVEITKNSFTNFENSVLDKGNKDTLKYLFMKFIGLV